MRSVYARRRGVLIGSLARHAPQVRLTGLAAGFYAVAHLPESADEQEVITARAPALGRSPRHGSAAGRCRGRPAAAGARLRGCGPGHNAEVAGSAADAARRIAIKLAALAQDGSLYGADEYDLDRYRQVGRLAAELLSVLSGRPAAELAVPLPLGRVNHRQIERGLAHHRAPALPSEFD
jgi:hypothetical protein